MQNCTFLELFGRRLSSSTVPGSNFLEGRKDTRSCPEFLFGEAIAGPLSPRRDRSHWSRLE